LYENEIKQEEKLNKNLNWLIKDKKIREPNNIVEVNSEDENGENLTYENYSLM